MAELTERQRLILALIIREYIETAQPVGSESLQKRYHLDASPATIRNDMAALTEAGYLRQPHTSAGRVPTEEGYRYFVRQLMGHIDLPAETKRTITHQFYQVGHDPTAGCVWLLRCSPNRQKPLHWSLRRTSSKRALSILN